MLVDPAAIAQLKNNAYGLTERWLYQTRFFLNRVDTSIGYFHTSELNILPDSVRCIVLPTPWSITPEQKEILEARFMRDGRSIVFCGTTALGTIKLEKNSTEMMPESRLDHGGNFGNRQFGMESKQPVAPTFSITDRKAKVFAHYTTTGKPSCATKKMPGWTAVFLGTSGLSQTEWRDLFKTAGCHLYLNGNDFSSDFEKPGFIQANGDFLMVQSATGGRKTIRLPKKAKQVYRFDTTRPKPMAINCSAFNVELEAGIPAFFISR